MLAKNVQKKKIILLVVQVAGSIEIVMFVVITNNVIFGVDHLYIMVLLYY